MGRGTGTAGGELDGSKTSRRSSRIKKKSNRKYTISRRAEACKRLGLTTVPIVNLAISRFIKSIEGGETAFIDYARFVDDEEVQNIINLWDNTTPSDREHLQIQDYCIKTSVSWAYLVGRVTQVMWERGKEETHAKMAQNHAKVVQKTIDCAMEKDGYRDREMIHKAAGFLPIPKGATIINKFQPQSTTATAITDGDEEEPDLLPAFERDSVKLQKTIRGELPAPESPLVPPADHRE